MLLLLASLAPHPAAAQGLSFSVPEMKLQVYVQPDGQARLVYDITFQNSEFGSTIDIVDIGTPHDGYDIGNMSASVDGVPVTEIRRSTEIQTGVEVHLGQKSIQPGQRGALHFEFTMPRLIFQDTTRRDYASLQISPFWFEDQYVLGTGTISIAVHMLPGINPDEMLYQSAPFTHKALFQDHAVAVWEFANARATGPHLVGVSFPKRGLTYVVPFTIFDLADKWLTDNPGTRVLLGVVAIGLFGFLFFRFSGGTGISVFLLLSAGLAGLFYISPLAHLFTFVPLVVLIIVNESSLRRRRREYLPAVAQVEGGGIKRGLTAPEAAALLELPLNKVLTLVLFGLLKKGVLHQVKDTPLTVSVDDRFQGKSPTGSGTTPQKYRLQAAQEKGIVLHDYEHGFLDVLEARSSAIVQNLDFGKPVKALIKGVAARMKGFDLSDTQDYYRSIIQRALTEAQSLGDMAMKEQAIDRNLEWILMDDHFPTVLQPRGYSYRPLWIRPLVAQSGGASLPAGSKSSSVGGRTSFTEVAASFAGWTENTMGSLAAAIAPSALQVPGKSGGFVNLSGADKVTGDIFEALAKSSSSGGGGRSGGGGCACACAGCACACACAGGGR